MNGSPEPVVHDGTSLQNRPVLVTVAVGHRSTLVAARLAVMLSRMPGCGVRRSESSPHGCSAEYPSVQLVFGDSESLKLLRGQWADSPDICSLMDAKFVCVTTGDESPARQAKAAGEIDELLSLECPQDHLVEVVRRLIGFEATENAIRLDARGGLAPGALRRVREYIDQHLAEKLRIDVLAHIGALSLGHFKRAFRQSMGLPPHQYVVRRRIAVATDLLRNTRRAVADIALEVGFADQSHFTRRYVAVTHETPSACRRRHR